MLAIQCAFPALPEKGKSEFIFRSQVSRNQVSRNHVPRSLSDPMTSKLLRSFLAIAVISMISAFAQTSSATAPASGVTSPAASAPIATGTGTKIGTINIEQAVVGTNEGQRDF